MLTFTVDSIEIQRKKQTDQTLIFSYVRGSLVDFSNEYNIENNKIVMGETFKKKTSLWYSSGNVQKKEIAIAIRIRDGPPQPKVKDSGFRQIALQKIDVSLYGTAQKVSSFHSLSVRLKDIGDKNFIDIKVNLQFRFSAYNPKDAEEKSIAKNAKLNASIKAKQIKKGINSMVASQLQQSQLDQSKAAVSRHRESVVGNDLVHMLASQHERSQSEIEREALAFE